MLRAVAYAALWALPGFAQPAFEVASLKPAQPPSGAPSPMAAEMMAKSQDRMFESRPIGWLPIEKTRLSLKNRSLAGLIASAYRVRIRQVTGPSWMAEDRFDVDATFPIDTPHAAVNDMLRALIEERFGLKAHREEKEESGYAIVQAKGGATLTAAAPKTTEDAPPPTDEERRANMEKMQAAMKKRMEEMKQQAASNGAGGFSTNTWSQPAGTMQDLADWFAALIGKPVVDGTELQGKYAFSVEVVRMGDDTQESAASRALAKLGLKLAPKKVAVGLVVVDQVDRTPKPN